MISNRRQIGLELIETAEKRDLYTIVVSSSLRNQAYQKRSKNKEDKQFFKSIS